MNRECGITVVVATHAPESVAAYATEAVCMREGRVEALEISGSVGILKAACSRKAAPKAIALPLSYAPSPLLPSTCAKSVSVSAAKIPGC